MASTYQNIIDGLVLFLANGDLGRDFAADHDVIYAGPEAGTLPEDVS